MSAEQQKRIQEKAPEGMENDWPEMSVEQKARYFLLAKDFKQVHAESKAVLEKTASLHRSLLGVMPPPEEGIGERIKEQRTSKGLNVEELARLTKEYDFREEGKGISASMLRRYEYKEGGAKPGAREICLLCDALDVSADWLLRGIMPKTDREAESLIDAFERFVKSRTHSTKQLRDQFEEGRTKQEIADREEKLRRARLPDKQ